MNVIVKIRNMVNQCLSWLCSILFMLLVVIGTYQIVVRYLFNTPSTVSEELLTYGFTWMALLASALVFGKREHMRMGFLADKISGTKRRILEIFIELLILFFVSVVMVYGGIQIVKLTMSQMTASLGVSMGVIYLAVLISGIVIVIYSILNILDLCLNSGNMDSERAFDEMQLHNKQLSEEEIEQSQKILKETEEV
ncbi:MAG: TRAP transporter small permease [Lachnospiraceae bacterium]|nr:TRAP transporter small permease [Lachnospiraceae bacterium]